jgi:hypothetical protein
MAGVINSGLLAKLMRPGLYDIFGVNYDQYEDEWTSLFEHAISNKNYEEETMVTTMGLAQVKPQGAGVTYDDIKQAFTSRYTHVEYALGFIVTKIEVEDNLYLDVSKMRTAGLAYSMKQTKNYNGANIFNYAFDAGGLHNGGDSVPLISSSHPTEAGLQSNALAVAADISEAALEEMLIKIYDARDNKNKKIALREKTLLIPSDLQFEATRLLRNPQRPGTAERDISALNNMGKFSNGVQVNHFLTDPDAWFVITTCPNGTKYFDRRALEFTDDNDFDTDNMKFKATERYSFGWSNWRSVYASPGA